MRKAEVRMQKLERPSAATPASMNISLRKAVAADVPRLRGGIEASVGSLRAGDLANPRRFTRAASSREGKIPRSIRPAMQRRFARFLSILNGHAVALAA